MNVAALIHAQAGERPDAVAFVTPRGIVTYAELRRMVGVIAHHLKKQGVEPGQVVGVSMGHNARHLMTILALAQIGAVSLPLHPALPAARRKLAAERFGAGLVVSGRPEMALDGLDFIGLGNLLLGPESPADDTLHPVDAGDPMRIVISSGTSGDPKAMVLSHALVALRNQTTEAGAGPGSRTLPMDLNFIVGFRPAMSALARGGVVVFPASLSPPHLLQCLRERQVTHAYVSPIQARQLAMLAPEGKAALPDMVCLRLGGGAVDASLMQQVCARLSPNVYISYGSTESGMITYASPDTLARHPDTVGPVCDWAEVEVVDEAGKALLRGVSGELRIRSMHQVSGYLNDDERSRHHFRNGWFYPGDLGHFDADGLLYIEGRLDEKLNIGGMIIDPDDVEATLRRHSAVTDAGAYASIDPAGCEVLAVALVLENPQQLEEVRRFVQVSLGPLAPASYRLVAALPRTPTGKLRRKELTACT